MILCCVSSQIFKDTSWASLQLSLTNKSKHFHILPKKNFSWFLLDCLEMKMCIKLQVLSVSVLPKFFFVPWMKNKWSPQDKKLQVWSPGGMVQNDFYEVYIFHAYYKSMRVLFHSTAACSQVDWKQWRWIFVCMWVYAFDGLARSFLCALLLLGNQHHPATMIG